jgi:hypothetical protein
MTLLLAALHMCFLEGGEVIALLILLTLLTLLTLLKLLNLLTLLSLLILLTPPTFLNLLGGYVAAGAPPAASLTLTYYAITLVEH